MVKKKVKKRVVKNPWFKRRAGNLKSGWGFFPINWKGWVALLLLVGLNIFSANYFGLNNIVFDNWSKFLVVFLLSMVVFILIAKRKTEGVKF
jgi:hypothetical protein